MMLMLMLMLMLFDGLGFRLCQLVCDEVSHSY